MAISPMLTQQLEDRFNGVRHFLEEQGLGALFVYSGPEAHQWGQTGHVSYLSGWANHDRIGDSAVVVPATGPASLLFAGLPYMFDQIREVCPLQDIRMVRAVDPQAVAVMVREGVDTGPREFADEAMLILQENGLGEKDIGVVGVDHMPVPFYESLSQRLGARLRRVKDCVAELRSIKSPGEIEAMRRAAQLSDLGFQTMVKEARAGMRGIEIVAEMERVIRKEGADFVQYWMASGPPPNWASVRMDIKPHERRLVEGDLMASCSYVLYKGYWCHGHRVGTLKRPSSELNKNFAIGFEAQDAGVAAIKPDVPVGRIAQIICQKAAENEFEIHGGRIGHGMGMDYSEHPGLSEDNDKLLQSGMAFVVHTAYTLPDSGKMFVPVGDVCHVVPGGVELLMEFPRAPFLAGQ